MSENEQESKNKFHNEYIDARWKGLWEYETESGEKALKYLFVTNGGGAAATLAFLGSKHGADGNLISIKVSLVLFFLGLIAVGIIHAIMVHDSQNVFNAYREDVSKYSQGKMTYEELDAADTARTSDSKIEIFIGYISFGSFILGCVVGAVGSLC